MEELSSLFLGRKVGMMVKYGESIIQYIGDRS